MTMTDKLGLGAYSTKEDVWTDYSSDVFDLDFTFKWKGASTVHVYDRARNFELFEAVPCMPTLEGAKAAIRRAKTRYARWISHHHAPCDETGIPRKKYGEHYEDIGDAGAVTVLLESIETGGNP